MDSGRGSQPPAAAAATAPAQRDMVFCHECENEWYRDEHGLTCPDCQSDFTEIIEEDHDPRADLLLDDHSHDSDMHDDDDDSNHDHDRDHNPWRNVPDPDEGNINEWHFTSTGPNRFTMNATIYRNFSSNAIPQQNQNQNQNQEGLANNFLSMVSGILGGAARPNMQQNQTQNQGEANSPGGQQHEGTGAGAGTGGPQIRTFGGAAGPRFTYTSTARLYPRDGNNPAHIEPLDDLHTILGAMFGPDFAQGAPRPGQQPGQQGAGNVPLNPMLALFGHLFNPGGVHGDAVYSQEALDRVISQLMEQNASGNAPGPASADAIANLSKRKITVEDFGTDGKAECSICMDEVDIGEEVTVLPCTHWFHGNCVSMWLGEHDTCPHCRKGIMPRTESQGNDNNNNGGNGAGGGSPGPSSRPPQPPQPYPPHSYPPSSPPPGQGPGQSQQHNMPGSFYSFTFTPHYFGQHPAPSRSRSRSQGPAPGGSSIVGAIRRSLFGGGGGGGSNRPAANRSY